MFRRRAALALVAAVLIAGNAQFALGGAFEGRVIGVIDGDTIDVIDERHVRTRVRLAGIDAPEAGMPFGQKAKRHLSDLILRKTVQVETAKHDQYGRTVGKIVCDGQDINLRMVEEGLAWHYKRYSSEQTAVDQDRYARAEVEARSQKRNLWGNVDPVPPWEWRASRKRE